MTVCILHLFQCVVYNGVLVVSKIFEKSVAAIVKSADWNELQTNLGVTFPVTYFSFFSRRLLCNSGRKF